MNINDLIDERWKTCLANQEVTLSLTLKRKEWDCVIQSLQKLHDDAVREHAILKALRDKLVEDIAELKQKLNDNTSTSSSSST